MFQLKNNRLTPVGGSAPAAVAKQTLGEGAVGTFAFNPRPGIIQYMNITATDYCDEAGNEARLLRTDNGEFVQMTSVIRLIDFLLKFFFLLAYDKYEGDFLADTYNPRAITVLSDDYHGM